MKEETVNPDDVILLNKTVIELRKAHVHLKMEVKRYFDGLKISMGQVCISLFFAIKLYVIIPPATKL